MENTVKDSVMIEVIVGVVGTVVTVINIFVTVISIRQTTKKEEHQKSNRPTKVNGCFFDE